MTLLHQFRAGHNRRNFLVAHFLHRLLPPVEPLAPERPHPALSSSGPNAHESASEGSFALRGLPPSREPFPQRAQMPMHVRASSSFPELPGAMSILDFVEIENADVDFRPILA